MSLFNHVSVILYLMIKIRKLRYSELNRTRRKAGKSKVDKDCLGWKYIDFPNIYGGMCHFWRNVPFLEKCDIFEGMCHLWRNVPFMEDCAIFGAMCHFLRNVPFWRHVPFIEECAIYGGMCHFWRNVIFLEECAIFWSMCHFWRNSTAHWQPSVTLQNVPMASRRPFAPWFSLRVAG